MARKTRRASLVPIEQLKTHKSGKFVITRLMLDNYQGDLKKLEQEFNQVVFDNPEFIFISHWQLDGSFVIEWQWMPWRTSESSSNEGSDSQSTPSMA